MKRKQVRTSVVKFNPFMLVLNKSSLNKMNGKLRFNISTKSEFLVF